MEVEGWGNVFIEAAACAKPVVVGDSGGAREALIDGETGVLVDGANVDAVADAVGDLLSDPDRARAMGERDVPASCATTTGPTSRAPSPSGSNRPPPAEAQESRRRLRLREAAAG
jgi:glycosyltransferase involved in cell wall biosynthesis